MLKCTHNVGGGLREAGNTLGTESEYKFILFINL